VSRDKARAPRAYHRRVDRRHDLTALSSDLSARERELDADLRGPFQVLAATDQDGHIRCEVSASRLVSVDPDDEALQDIVVPVPVVGAVELDRERSIVGSSFGEPGPDETREARAFAKGLLARGVVRGYDAPAGAVRVMRGRGPGTRVTHELVEDPSGRRVLRRVGFDSR
jgi:hypothetical protein